MRVLSVSYFIRRIATCCVFLCLAASASATTFKNPPLIPTSSDVLGIATADVNHDGKFDLIYADGQAYGQHALHVLLGNGDGTFAHGQDISLPAGLCCVITIADVNHDGNPDIIMQGSLQFVVQVAVLVGNGDGTFQAPLLSSFQPNNISGYPGFNGLIGVGDINGDGHVDLVLNDRSNGALYLLLGDNSGKFTLANTLFTYTRDSVYLVDLNGDHHLDIVATDLLGATFLVFLGNGDGTFQNYSRYTGQPSTGAFTLVDLDGDGHPDMLTEYYPAQLGVFKGNPDGTFGALSSLGSATSPSPLVGVNDFNSDGIPDLTFITATGVGVELGKGNLTYSPMHVSVSGATTTFFSVATSPVAGDFNKDGFMDLAMPVEGGIVILFGKNDGTFSSADFYDMGQEVGAAAVADFNGDKFPDIAVTLPATFPRVLLGDGKGAFTLGPDPNTSYASQGAAVILAAADFNGDGKMDLSLGNMLPNTASFGTQSVTFGLGNGTFTTPLAGPNISPNITDFNGDGRSDMISISGTTVTVLLGQANETFNSITTTLRIAAFIFGVGDVNKDGKPDLVLNYPDHLEVWLGIGDGTFSYSGTIPTQGLGYNPIVAVADLDGDGNADIVLGPITNPAADFGPLTIFYGGGNGTFEAPVFLPVSHRFSQVVVADLNRDNKPDLVMTDGYSVAVMMNLGGRKFDSEMDYVAGGTVSALSVADINGDGYPDIVAANPGGTTVTILLNQPNGTSPNGLPVSGTFSISPEPSVAGQSFAMSLTVSGETTGAPVPTGSVSFSVDGAFVATVPLANATASCTVSAVLIPVPHTVAATYNGDKLYAPKSFAAVHLVNPPVYATQTSVAVSPSAVLASQTVRLSASVTSVPQVPSGVVTFFDGTNVLGAKTVDATGRAYFDTALLAVGMHSLTTKYQGYTQPSTTGTGFSYTVAIFTASSSAAISLPVTANATTTVLAASPPVPTAGTVVTFSASVTSGAGVPFGGVTFYDANTILGTSGLKSDATASFSTASLAAGSHTIVATFNANGPFAASTSPALSLPLSVAPASSVATFVSLTTETNSTDGNSVLLANVSAMRGSPAGTITFLDSGTILGTALIDGSGFGRLNIGPMKSGIHSLTVSFGGSGEFAPNVSPELREQWPPTGPGFSLAVVPDSLRVPSPQSRSLRLSIVPAANFRQQVQLSCEDGLPAGYTCVFSPAMVEGGGSSTLVIQPWNKVAGLLSKSKPVYEMAFGVFLCLMLGWVSRRRSRFLLMLLVCSMISLFYGCRSSFSSSENSHMSVLTIRGASGTGEATIFHSAQISISVPSIPLGR